MPVPLPESCQHSTLTPSNPSTPALFRPIFLPPATTTTQPLTVRHRFPPTRHHPGHRTERLGEQGDNAPPTPLQPPGGLVQAWARAWAARLQRRQIARQKEGEVEKVRENRGETTAEAGRVDRWEFVGDPNPHCEGLGEKITTRRQAMTTLARRPMAMLAGLWLVAVRTANAIRWGGYDAFGGNWGS